MKFLIISDLHACPKSSEQEHSRLVFDGVENEFGTRFIEYCKSINLYPDFLVCPGDISNHGCADSFKNGWGFLKEVQSQLEINGLLCVPGNHDLQSRPGIEISPLHQVKFCAPPFPSNEYEFNTHFWAWGWGHISYDNFNCIFLNSSAYHGFNDEFKHGRVAQETVSQIVDYIKSDKFEEKAFNILLCHHHPVKREEVDYGSDFEVMDGGQLLISSIEQATSSPWLIIHGHKHFASLFSASSAGYNPPLIFSAGSFSARLYPEISERTTNQFYVLDINLEKTSEDERLIGTFEAHSWDIKNNWHPSKSKNLPHKGGFGSDVRPKEVIEKLNTLLEGTTYLNSDDLIEVNDVLQHLTPTQYDQLIIKLNNEFEVELSDNLLFEVSKNA
ncbi:metallophosphoesterase [Pseudoalteromonas sp. P1-25]|uniref:metallophosphoesterase family protein n=1 Tax=Pseudoalteromonas sp. P1-25 TaxID=1723758 RepID=UPI0006D68C51|nr:metallophosphoesterase [Pseudoalteromonas sp. P1-25]KPZ56863.1 Calcineurin-like phosphoesterase [Pseudoalteromonas sp. P1-25]